MAVKSTSVKVAMQYLYLEFTTENTWLCTLSQHPASNCPDLNFDNMAYTSVLLCMLHTGRFWLKLLLVVRLTCPEEVHRPHFCARSRCGLSEFQVSSCLMIWVPLPPQPYRLGVACLALACASWARELSQHCVPVRTVMLPKFNTHMQRAAYAVMVRRGWAACCA